LNRNAGWVPGARAHGATCFLSARNLGDAAIHADFLRVLVGRGAVDQVVAWTFPAARFLFEGIERTAVVASDFPMGASRRGILGLRGIARFVAALRSVRAVRPEVCIELVGDVRERIVARWTGAPQRLSPSWPSDHPFRRHIRGAADRDAAAVLRPTAPNVYAACGEMLQALTGRGWDVPAPRPPRDGPLCVGVHATASVPHKLWPEPAWRALIASILRLNAGARVTLFGAPSEREQLVRWRASAFGDAVDVATDPLPEFRRRLGRQDVLIGLDSFSVHLAHSVGVPSVVLVGANDPELFRPPSGVAVSRLSDCPDQPCHGKPRCVGTEYEYACMRAIAPSDVLAATDVALRSTP
jgi:heptosyltransferase-3